MTREALSTPLTLRAISQDHRVQIDQICALFEECYEKSFPVQSVYNAPFWKHHINIRFSSVGVFSGRELIGHFSYCRDKRVGSVSFIQHLAFSRRAHERVLELVPLIDSFLSELASRHRSRTLACFVPSSLCQGVFIAEQGLGCGLASIWPNYFSQLNRENQGKATDGFLFARTLDDSESAELPLYLPQKHQSCIERLFGRTGNRNGPRATKRDIGTVFPADQPAVSVQPLPEVGVHLVFVHPSLASDLSQLASEMAALAAPGGYHLAVDATDPLCPGFAECLEENGFSFCGIAPLFHHQLALVYSVGAPNSRLYQRDTPEQQQQAGEQKESFSAERVKELLLSRSELTKQIETFS